MKEFLNNEERVSICDGCRVVNGDVACFVNVADFVEQAEWVEVVFEGLLVDEGSEVVVVGKLEVWIVGVEPMHSLL